MNRKVFFILWAIVPLFFSSNAYAAWPGQCNTLVIEPGTTESAICGGTQTLVEIIYDESTGMFSHPVIGVCDYGQTVWANLGRCYSYYYENGQWNYQSTTSLGYWQAVLANFDALEELPTDCTSNCSNADEAATTCGGSEQVIWDNIQTCEYHCDCSAERAALALSCKGEEEIAEFFDDKSCEGVCKNAEFGPPETCPVP